MIGVFALLRKRSLMTDALSHATLPGIAIAFLAAGWLGLEGRSLPVLLLGRGGERGARACVHPGDPAVLAAARGRGDRDRAQRLLRRGHRRAELHPGERAARVGGPQHVHLRAGRDDAARRRAADGRDRARGRLAAALLLKEFALVCFNDAFARVDGWPVSADRPADDGLVVVVTVAGLQAVGLILVVAMLIIPPVSARFWTERLWVLVLARGRDRGGERVPRLGRSRRCSRASPRGGDRARLGRALRAELRRGAGAGCVATGVRRLRLRLRIAGDHLLERAHTTTGAADLDGATLVRSAGERGWSRLFARLVLAALRAVGPGLATGGGGVGVTGAGLARGARVARNHALWEQYLVSYADIAPSHVDWSVDQVEHVLSDELVAELERALAAGAGAAISVPGTGRGSGG
jgi:manganese/zinc/iron transport system permease protein